jgi:hypothetical protein
MLSTKVATLFSVVGISGALIGCSTPALTHQGSTVLASRNAPSAEGFDPRSCKNLGEVYGKGGGSFGGAWISNEQLAEYAISDMRNKAAERGGNYVQYESPTFGESGSEGSSNVSSAMVAGTAYDCEQPPAAAAPAAAPVAQPAPTAAPAAPVAAAEPAAPATAAAPAETAPATAPAAATPAP